MADTDTEEIVEAWHLDPRWAYPVACTISVWAAGWAPRIAEREGGGFPPWMMAVAGLAVAVFGYIRAGRAYPRDDYGVGMAEHASLLAIVAGVVIGGWLVFAGYTSPWKAAGLLVLAAVVLGGWWALVLTLAPRRHADEMDRLAAMMAADEDAATRDILDRAGCEDVRMYGTTEHRGGYSVEIGPDPDWESPPSYSDVVGRRDKLTTHLGMYWRRKNGTVLHEQDVNIEKLAVDRWLLHVSTKHVLEKTVPFMPDTSSNGGPPSFNDRLLLGLYEDGNEIRAKLHGRGAKVVGTTGGGKSVFLNNVIGRTLECRAPDGRPDALVMVIATDKLVPLVYNWLVPWFNRDRPHPAIAGVFGQEQERANRALVGLYDLVRDRNSRLARKSKHEASPDLPGILVILEEATLLTAASFGKILMNEPDDEDDEVWWSVSRLLNKTLALARSSGVSIFFATQFGLVDALGEEGSEIMRNLPLRCCLLTLAAHDGPATLPGLPATVDTTTLENNSLYFQNGIGEKSRAVVGKAGFLDEDNVIPVARKVSEQVAQLSDRDIDAFGRDLWETRWDVQYHPDLARAAAEDDQAPGGNGYTWPGHVVAAPPPAPVTPAPVPPPPAVITPPPPVSPPPVTVPVDDGTDDDVDDAADESAAGGAAPDLGAVDPNAIDWDDALKKLTGTGTDTPADPNRPATGRGSQQSHGLPWDAIDKLEYWARKCREEADDYERRTRGAGPDDGAEDDRPDEDGPPDDDPYRDDPVTGWCRRPLPEPLGSVLAYIDEHHMGDNEWVPTAELADAALGPDVKDNAAVLGKALSVIVPGLRATRNAKSYGPMRGRPEGRGRGFMVADLRAAADAWRAGKDLRP